MLYDFFFSLFVGHKCVSFFLSASLTSVHAPVTSVAVSPTATVTVTATSRPPVTVSAHPTSAVAAPSASDVHSAAAAAVAAGDEKVDSFSSASVSAVASVASVSGVVTEEFNLYNISNISQAAQMLVYMSSTGKCKYRWVSVDRSMLPNLGDSLHPFLTMLEHLPKSESELYAGADKQCVYEGSKKKTKARLWFTLLVRILMGIKPNSGVYTPRS
jgi:hypothetical protein